MLNAIFVPYLMTINFVSIDITAAKQKDKVKVSIISLALMLNFSKIILITSISFNFSGAINAPRNGMKDPIATISKNEFITTIKIYM